VVTNEKAHRELWLKNAMENTPSLADMKAASFDFADGLRRHLGQVSWEARPGRSTGVLPGVNDAPYEQQAEFQHAVAEALTGKNGEDMLAKKLGLLVDGKVMAPGVWQSEVAPSHQEFVSMPPVKGGPGVPKVAPEIRELMNTYADLMGLLLRQDGVGWHKPFFTVAKSHHNGVDIDIGRSLTAEEAVAFEKALGSLLPDGGLSRVGIISTDKGVRTISEDERLWDNKSFRAAAFAAAETALPDFESRSFASDGALRTNDWKESPNGEGYRQRLSASGRSDVLGWAADVLAPRVQSVFDDFSKRYGWGDPGKINLEPVTQEEFEEAMGGWQFSRGQDQGDGAARPLEGLPATVQVDGKPVTFGPFQPAHDAARDYMAKAGLRTTRPRST
jgi:hypothetical protein